MKEDGRKGRGWQGGRGKFIEGKKWWDRGKNRDA